jgi:hypothetical protein
MAKGRQDMIVIRRNKKASKERKFPAFGGQINLWAYKTKEMKPSEQEQLVKDHPDQFLPEIRIQVTSLDGSVVLVDAIVPLEEFTSGSIGYKFKVSGATFEEA